MVYDFHTHTFLSDGVLSPIELVRRAHVSGYRAIGITDHVGFGTQVHTIAALVEECARASQAWNIEAIPGVELTHVPPNLIDEAARKARQAGARLVIVHGETIVEPVEEGTNLAAVSSPYVDVLAHPGLLSVEEARIAGQNHVFIELSTRKGHSLTNGHVARAALLAGASLILDSDSHAPEDLLTLELAHRAARGAGLDDEDVYMLLETAPVALLEKIQQDRK